MLAGYLAFGATFQELPGWLHERFGSGAATSGLAIGIAFAATAGCRPFAGRLGDAQHARPVVMAGGVLIAVGALGQLLAPNVPLLLAARLVMGAGEAGLFSAALPWVLAAAAPNQRGRVAGWFGLSMWGGLAAGPLVAVGVGHLSGSHAVWLAVTSLGVVSAVLVTVTPGQTGERSGPSRSAGWRDIVPDGAGLPGLAFGLAAYGYGTISAVLILYLTDSGIGGASIGLVVFAGAFLATRSLGSPTVDRYGGATVATVVLGVEVVGLILLATVEALPAALIGAAMVGVGLSLTFPATVAMTLSRTETAGAGSSIGATTSFWDLGILAAGPVSGLLATGPGYSAAFFAAAAAGLASLAVSAHLRRPQHRAALAPIAPGDVIAMQSRPPDRRGNMARHSADSKPR